MRSSSFNGAPLLVLPAASARPLTCARASFAGLQAAKVLAAGGGAGGDEEAGTEEEARAALERAEFQRAQERLTLRHKNSSRWARRLIKRGLDKVEPPVPRL